MHDGEDGTEPATLGAFGYFAAIVLCCIIVGALAYGLGRENERRYETPASYAKAAKADAQSACTGREDTAAFECIYEKVEAAQEQARGEQDLSAQQKAANATLLGAIVGVFTLILSAVGVWYVKRTLEATLIAVEDTGKATDEMQRANSIASRSTREQMASSRPILQADPSTFLFRAEPEHSNFNLNQTPPHPHPVESLHVKFAWHNFGNQPAWLESSWIGFYLKAADDDFPNVPFLQYRGLTAGFVAPGQNINEGGSYYRLRDEDTARLNAGGVTIILCGMCQYRSSARHLFNTSFAFHLNVGSGPNCVYPVQKSILWRDGRVANVKMKHDDHVQYLD